MQENKQDLHRFDAFERLQGNRLEASPDVRPFSQHGAAPDRDVRLGMLRPCSLISSKRTRSRSKLLIRLILLVVGILSILSVAIPGPDFLFQVKVAHAKSQCGILFVCPTPTPNPLPSPTPVGRPQTSPTPVPPPLPSPTSVPKSVPGVLPTPVPTPSPTPSPTVSPTVSPTATPVNDSIKVAQTPVPSPASSVTKGGTIGSQTTNRSGGNGFSPLVVIALIIFLCLLLSLGIGWFTLRRALLPSIDIKLPPSGAFPWSPSGRLNPHSQGDNE